VLSGDCWPVKLLIPEVTVLHGTIPVSIPPIFKAVSRYSEYRYTGIGGPRRDRQKISILLELTACQKNVANALNSVGIILKNSV